MFIAALFTITKSGTRFITGRMDKQDGVYSCNGISLNYKKKLKTDLIYSVVEPQKYYSKLKETEIKDDIVQIPFIRGIQNRLVVDRAGGVGLGSDCFVNIGFIWRVIKCFETKQELWLHTEDEINSIELHISK